MLANVFSGEFSRERCSGLHHNIPLLIIFLRHYALRVFYLFLFLITKTLTLAYFYCDAIRVLARTL